MNFIMSSNQVPFLKASLITGLMCVVITLTLFELSYTFIVIPVLVQLTAQCIFNNWYWTKKELAETKALINKGNYEKVQSH